MASKLTLLGNALKSSSLSRNHLRRLPMRSISTGAEVPEPSSDPFLQPPQGLIFGKLTGIGWNTLKTDVIHFFEGCNLTSQDVKVEYNKAYTPVGMLVQFPSRSAFDTAVRIITRKGRLYKLEKVDRGYWDMLTSYNGKVVLLQGIPRNALPEDVERFLSGCDFNASSTQVFNRVGFPDPIRMALVHFPTSIQAMNAFCVKNHSFCLNNRISMRVLQ